jgi:hypothetical protein
MERRAADPAVPIPTSAGTKINVQEETVILIPAISARAETLHPVTSVNLPEEEAEKETISTGIVNVLDGIIPAESARENS